MMTLAFIGVFLVGAAFGAIISLVAVALSPDDDAPDQYGDLHP